MDENIFTLRNDPLVDLAKKAISLGDKESKAQEIALKEMGVAGVQGIPLEKRSEYITRYEQLLNESVNSHELILHADNTQHLHNHKKDFIRNIKRRKSGTYDSGKGHKLWSYYADRVAQDYHKEHGDPKTPWHKAFPKSVRHEVASHYEKIHRPDKDGNVEEESQEVNELSKETLKSYIEKAEKSKNNLKDAIKSSDSSLKKKWKSINKSGPGSHRYTLGQEYVSSHDEREKQRVKLRKRHNNILGATKKLTKEDQEINELSKKTLASYINKASRNIGKQTSDAIDNWNQSFEHSPVWAKSFRDKSYKNRKNVVNRQKGIFRAVKNLTKEDQEINELSKKTLASYIKKAHPSAMNSERASSKSFELGTASHKDPENRDFYKKIFVGHLRKMTNREDGINRAADKLAKEDLDEGMKLVKTYDHPNGKSSKVYRDSEWDEYRVKFHKNGVHQKNADYHTNDKDDAHSTAQYWLKEGVDFLDEKLDPSKGVKAYIHDFVKSKNVMFKNDSKKERIKRALGAYYSEKNEDNNQTRNGDDSNGYMPDTVTKKSFSNYLNDRSASVYNPPDANMSAPAGNGDNAPAAPAPMPPPKPDVGDPPASTKADTSKPDVNSSPKLSPFGAAFKKARADAIAKGLNPKKSVFTWNGKKYTTRLKGE